MNVYGMYRTIRVRSIIKILCLISIWLDHCFNLSFEWGRGESIGSNCSDAENTTRL